jgi:hypothetical protein
MGRLERFGNGILDRHRVRRAVGLDCWLHGMGLLYWGS